MKKSTKNLIMVPIVSVSLLGGFVLTEYHSMPGISDKYQLGRTKNALATVVSGIVAQELCSELKSNFNLDLERTLFFDSTVSGKTSDRAILTSTDNFLTDTIFVAEKKYNASGEYSLVGKIKKPEFNWDLVQVFPNAYEIRRALLKADHTLELNVGSPNAAGDGKIYGQLNRGFGFDWGIDGTYNSDNNIDVSVSVPLGLDIRLSGKINCS